MNVFFKNKDQTAIYTLVIRNGHDLQIWKIE